MPEIYEGETTPGSLVHHPLRLLLCWFCATLRLHMRPPRIPDLCDDCHFTGRMTL